MTIRRYDTARKRVPRATIRQTHRQVGIADAKTCDWRISHDFALSLIRMALPFFMQVTVLLWTWDIRPTRP